MDKFCIWDDCDQAAVYCAGHAREFAAAPTLYAENVELKAANAALLAALRDILAIKRTQTNLPGTVSDRAMSYAGALLKIADIARAALAKATGGAA